jgi:cell division protein FtsB
MSVELEWKKKNKRLKVALSITTILDILLGAGLAITYNSYIVDSNVQTAIDLRSQLASAQTTITNQQQIILRENGTIHALNDQVKTLTSRVTTLTTQVNGLQNQLNEANKRISELELKFVSLSGNVKTTGQGAYPKSINFESEGIRYSLAVNGTGGYSIKLPNNHVYKITIDWGVLDPRAGLGGNDPAKESPFRLQSTSPSMIKDFTV